MAPHSSPLVEVEPALLNSEDTVISQPNTLKSIVNQPSREDVVKGVDQWLHHADKDDEQRSFLDILGTHLKALIGDVYTLSDEATAVDENVFAASDAVRCSECEEFYVHPYVLPCGHTFCGVCLENAWRPLLSRRWNRMTISGGVQVRNLCRNGTLPDNEPEFVDVMTRIDSIDPAVAKKLTTYNCLATGCTRKVNEAPAFEFHLAEFCAKVRDPVVDSTFPKRPDHFRCLFFKRITEVGDD